MSHSLSGGAPEPPDFENRPERAKVRTRVRVRTAEAIRADSRKNREDVLRVLLYLAVGVGGLLMIWLGLKVFVRAPAMPRAMGPSEGMIVERSPA